MDVLAGRTLMRKNGEMVSAEEAMTNVEVIGLYFSAHWCPPCRFFTPLLAEFHAELKEANEPFEVVFISSDETKEEMMSYMNESHGDWLAVPFGEDILRRSPDLSTNHFPAAATLSSSSQVALSRQLAKKYGIRGIPALVIIRKVGEVITTSGRMDVQMFGRDAVDFWRQGKGAFSSIMANKTAAGKKAKEKHVLQDSDEDSDPDLAKVLAAADMKARNFTKTSSGVNHGRGRAGGGRTRTTTAIPLPPPASDFRNAQRRGRGPAGRNVSISDYDVYVGRRPRGNGRAQSKELTEADAVLANWQREHSRGRAPTNMQRGTASPPQFSGRAERVSHEFDWQNFGYGTVDFEPQTKSKSGGSLKDIAGPSGYKKNPNKPGGSSDVR